MGRSDKSEGRAGAPFLRSMEVFLAVLEARNFSNAAKALSISQPTVSQRIQGLEQALGVELFSRASGGVEPTAAGRVLAVYAERLLTVRDEMLEELAGRVALKRGTLRIGASTTPGNYVMPTLLQRFRERYSGMRVVMQIADSQQILDQVNEGSVELGVVGSLVSDHRFISEPFIDDEVVVIARPGHPLLASPEVTLEELTDYTWIVREVGSGTRAAVEGLMAQARLKRKIRVGLECDSTEAIKLAARAGEGIALVSRRAVENELALGLLGTTQLPRPGLRRQFFLVRSEHRSISPAARGLWDHLVGVQRIASGGPAQARKRKG